MLLRSIVLSLVIASAFVLWHAFRVPQLVRTTVDVGDTSAVPQAISNADYTRDLDEFAPLLNRNLGSPLHAAVNRAPDKALPAVVKIAPTKTRKKRNRRAETGLRVIGTMIEEGRSVAIVVDSKGSIQLRSEGESIDTPSGTGRVDRIELDKIVIAMDGETLTLKMP